MTETKVGKTESLEQLQIELLKERLLRIGFQMQLLGLMQREAQKQLASLLEKTETNQANG